MQVLKNCLELIALPMIQHSFASGSNKFDIFAKLLILILLKPHQNVKLHGILLFESVI